MREDIRLMEVGSTLLRQSYGDRPAARPRGEPLRLLVVGLNFFPEPTGVGRYTGDMAFWLAARGHHIEVVTAPPYYPQWRRHPGYRYGRWTRERINGVTVHRCPLDVPGSSLGLRRALHLSSFAASSGPVVLARARRLRPDWIFCVEPTMLSFPAALAAARSCGSRLWLHVQDIELAAAERTGGLGPALGALRVLYRELLRRADMVSTLGETMRGQLLAMGAPPDRSRLLPNWIDVVGFDRERGGRARSELGIATDETLVMYAGALGAKQGVDQLATVVEQVPDDRVRFIFCGFGPMRGFLEARVGNDPRVRFLDPLPDADYRALMAVTDVHLVPQQTDNSAFCMPSKLLAMLACDGAIVVQADAESELARLLHNAALLAPPGDGRALAAAVRRAMTEPIRHSLQMHARRRELLRLFDRDAVLRGLEAELTRAAARRQAHTGHAAQG